MPEIPIGDIDGHLRAVDVTIVQAVMHYPRDQRSARELIGRRLEKQAARLEEDWSSGQAERGAAAEAAGAYLGKALAPFGGLRLVADAPGHEEIEERMKRQMWPGVLSGQILLNVLIIQAAKQAVKRSGSVKKAIAMLQESLSEASTKGNSGPGKKTRYLQGVWQNFKPAAHLWAAFCTWADSEDDKKASCFPGTVEGLKNFLAISERFRVLGEKHRSHGQVNPLLPPGELWVPPPRVCELLPKAFVSLPHLEGWAADAIERYRAPSYT